jgi:hypothetical protein
MGVAVNIAVQRDEFFDSIAAPDRQLCWPKYTSQRRYIPVRRQDIGPRAAHFSLLPREPQQVVHGLG